MRFQIFLMSVLAGACSLPSAGADEYVSPEGFRIPFPDGWKLAGPAETGKLVEAVKKKSKADPGIVAYIRGAPSEDVTPLINVIVRKGPIVLNPELERGMLNGFKQSIPKGAPPPQFKTSHILVGGRMLSSIAYETEERQKKPLRVWVVMFQTRSGLCVMNCSALKSQWKDAGPVFRSAIYGLKFN